MAGERIEADMTPEEVVRVMGKGNPGAMHVCVLLLNHGGKIDPDALGGGLASILSLDTLGIYEERIWRLFKDVCDNDIRKMVAVLRAYQLGQLAGVSEESLNHAIDNCGEGIDFDAVVEEVTGRLQNFRPNVAF